MNEIPPNRWELSVSSTDSRYAQVFEDLIERGEDIDGEARLVDVLAPRAARILDAGAGLGRVAAALAARGHDVTAVEKDRDLIDRSHRHFPDVPVVETDILGLTPDLLEAAGRPTAYDVVVLVGNVMVYLAEGTETRALRILADLLVPDGRILVGFHPLQGPSDTQEYPFEVFHGHASEAGLQVEHRFGTYDLAPPAEDYVVAVLRHR